MTLTPAYGRDYKSKAAVEKDFRDGKDFRVASPFGGGCYVTVKELPPGSTVTLRYKKLTMAHVVKV